jgi:hypothetical protein
MPSFPVTVSLPRQPSRRLFALSVGSAKPSLIAPEVARPAFVKLDAAFAAAPIGTGDAAGLSLGALDAETSERFAVRGSWHGGGGSFWRHPPSGRRRADFRRPAHRHRRRSGMRQNLGTCARCGEKLRVLDLAAARLDGDGVALAIVDAGVNLAQLAAQLGGMPKLDIANSFTPPG